MLQKLEDEHDPQFMTKPTGYMFFRASLSGDVAATELVNWLKTAPPANLTSVRIEAAIVNARHMQSAADLMSGTNKMWSQGSIFEKLSRSAQTEIIRTFQGLDTTMATAIQCANDQNLLRNEGKIQQTFEEIEQSVVSACQAVATPVLTQLGQDDIARASENAVIRTTGTSEAITLYEKVHGIGPVADPSVIPTQVLTHMSPGLRFANRRYKSIDVIFERYGYDPDPDTSRPYPRTLRQITNMTALLHESPDAMMGILPCLGYSHDKASHSLAVAFRAPPYYDLEKRPTTLLETYKNVPRVYLGYRIRLASVLATMLDHFHVVGWVHKGIRSENVAFLPMQIPGGAGQHIDLAQTFVAPQGSIDLARPYLFGFEYMRLGEEGTNLEGDYVLERNLYRHPDRWGQPLLKFEKSHDIFALVRVPT